MLRSISPRKMVLLAAAALVFVTPFAHAMKIKQQNLTQLISASESIIHGTVKSVTDGIDDKGVPFTEVTIAVGSSAKGNVDDGADYTFRQFGLLKPRAFPNGKTLVAVTPEGLPRWTEGETVVAFMYKPARMTGLRTTAGVAQGKFTQVNGTLINGFRNAGLFDSVYIDDTLLSDEHRSMMREPGAVDAATFIDLVGKAVAGNWIETGGMK